MAWKANISEGHELRLRKAIIQHISKENVLKKMGIFNNENICLAGLYKLDRDLREG